jgi:signal transduction histidine kinase
MGHRQLLAQALANLIDNALKFTPAGGRVQITVQADGGRLVLTVADTGPGIPAGDRVRAVEPFVRLSDTPSREGAGLGLSLAAAVARLHGGSLRLEDNQPGLLVTLDLPLA